MGGRVRLVLWLARKDWRLFLADRRAALLCFAIPVVLAAGFGAIFQSREEHGNLRLPLTLVVEDESPLTQRVVADLRASEQLDVSIADRAAAQREVARRGAGVVLVLPAGFGQVTENPSQAPTVELLYNPLSGAESQWAEGVLTEVVMRRLAADWLEAIPGAPRGEALRRPFEVSRTTITTNGAGSAFDSNTHSFCGMTLQYLMFWGMDSGLLLLQERRRGLWFRLRSAPVTWWALIAGKCLAISGVAILMIAVTFGIGVAFFGVQLTGSFVGFAALSVASALVAAATGLFVATLGGTEAQARNLSVVVILAASLLGGLWLPSFLLPGWVRTAAAALPISWAARGLNGVTWQGMGTWESLRCAGVVAAFGVACLGLATVRFARLEAAQRRGGIR